MDTIIWLLSQAWFGSVLGLLGLLSAIYFYFRGKKVSRIGFQHNAITLAGSVGAAFSEDVEISFQGRRIPRVTAKTVVLWNAGNTTILGDQLLASDPLRFELEKGEILKAEVLRVAREVNAISVASLFPKMNAVGIQFEFLDPGDGITFQVVHTGSRNDLHVRGTIRGIVSGPKNLGVVPLYASKSARTGVHSRQNNIFLGLFAAGAIFLGISTVFTPEIKAFLPHIAPAPDPNKRDWGLALMSASYAFIPLWFYWLKRRRYPSCLHTEADGK